MKNQSVKFWNKIAERYSRKPIVDEVAYQKKLAKTRDYFQPDMEVLELGCGTGSTAIVHAPYVKHIRAIDISSKMIEIARGKARACNIDNIAFEIMSIEELSVADRTVDMVLAFSILHLVERKESVIARIYSMLKPGGLFVSSTTCLGDTMKFFTIVAPVGKFFGVMPLVKVFTVKELKNAIVDAGFEIDHQWQPGRGKAVFIVAKKIAK